VVEHLGGGKQQGAGIGNFLACNVRRRAVYRFKNGRFFTDVRPWG